MTKLYDFAEFILVLIGIYSFIYGAVYVATRAWCNARSKTVFGTEDNIYIHDSSPITEDKD